MYWRVALRSTATSDEVMSDKTLGSYIRRLMTQSLTPALAIPPDFDIAAYREELLARFANPFLQHRCAQIAMDGSEKIPQRWLPVLNKPELRQALVPALAAWCVYVLDSELEISDPCAARLKQLCASSDPLRLQSSSGYADITAETVTEHE